MEKIALVEIDSSVDNPPFPAYEFPCPTCKHLNEWNGEKETCKAFPNGIPDQILSGQKHNKPTRTQKNDIVFEAIK